MKSIGGVPLWNPLTMTGSSWIGQDVQGNILHTFDILFLLINDPISAYMLGLIAFYFITLFCSYLVFIDIFLFSIAASIISVSVYAFIPELQHNIVNLFTIGTFAGIPVLLLVTNQLIKTKHSKYIIIAAITTSIGYYSSTILNLQSLLLLFLIFLFSLQYIQNGRIDFKNSTKIYAIYFLLTILLCSPILIPSVLESFDGIRSRIPGKSITSSLLHILYLVISQFLTPFDYLKHQSLDYMTSVNLASSAWPKWYQGSLSTSYYGILPLISLINIRCFIEQKRYRLLLIFLILPLLINIIQVFPFIWDIIYKITGGHGIARSLDNLMIFACAGLTGFIINEVINKHIILNRLEKSLIIFIISLSAIILLISMTTFTTIFVVVHTFYDEISIIFSNEELKNLFANILGGRFKNIANVTGNEFTIIMNNITTFFSTEWFIRFAIFSINKILLFTLILLFLVK